ILDRENNEVVFTTRDTSVKARNLARTGYAALSVTDDIAPYSHVALEGTVTTDEDPERLRKWATTIAGKYMGADRAEELGAQNGAPGEQVCRMKIVKINGMSSVTD
ncbi:MAG: pyridoxamine 5'-phosphate oxidase family protein, partial [Thermomicrobiales bacterium]